VGAREKPCSFAVNPFVRPAADDPPPNRITKLALLAPKTLLRKSERMREQESEPTDRTLSTLATLRTPNYFAFPLSDWPPFTRNDKAALSTQKCLALLFGCFSNYWKSSDDCKSSRFTPTNFIKGYNT